MNIPKKNWYLLVERRYLPFSISLNMFFSGPDLEKVAPFGSPDDYFAMYKDGAYLPAGQIEQIAAYQIKQLRTQGPRFLWMMTKRCVEQGKKLIEDTKEVMKTNLASLDNKKIAQLFDFIGTSYRAFTPFLPIPLSMEKFFDEELQKIIKKRLTDDKKVAEYHQRLIHPIKFNVNQEETIALLKIATEIEKRGITDLTHLPEDLRRAVEQHARDFGWLQIRWFSGKALTPEDIIQRLKTLIAEKPAAKLKELSKKNDSVKKDMVKICKELRCTPEEKELISLTKAHVFLRTYRADILNETNYLIMPLVQEAAKRLGIPYDDILYLTRQEIAESLCQGRVLAYINIEKRKKAWALFREGDEAIILQGEQEVEKFGKKQGFAETSSTLKEVKGTKAYAGKVIGPVRIVLSPEEVIKVKKGDVLVAVMTFPSYIVAMERASAFVTDEGGILSHAAIISREMKKPCIIGTKIATKVLKDGDIVEVDANKGVVRKVMSR